MNRLAFVLLIVFAGLAGIPADAAAQDADDDRAHTLFVRGREAFAQAHYEQALQLFQRAYEASARPELLYNIGQTADRLRLDDVALDAFHRYLGAAPDADHRAEVEARIAALERVRADATTPAATIPAATVPDSALAAPERAHDLTHQAWFWPVVIGGAALVIVAIVIGAVLASAPGTESPVPGNVGGVVFALDGP